MVNDDKVPGPVRRREIVEADLAAVAALLVRGFPSRPPDYWRRGLRRLGARDAVAGRPRFGFLLEAEGAPVGVVLTLFAPEGPGRPPRCNLSSWYVAPAFRMQAPLLLAPALRRPDVTYTNISPAPHTWATIEAQGFAAYAAGQTLVAPALAARGEPARVVARPTGGWRDLPEAALLDDHAAYGCTSLAVAAADGLHPFVFLPFRMRSGRVPLPFMQLVFCRDMAALSRFARPLGRALLARGYPAVVIDGVAPDGLPVLGRVPRGRRYFKGPHPPRIGDLAYSERVVFGA